MMSASRAGNGPPAGSVVGNASAAASETTPRIPAQDSTSEHANGHGMSCCPRNIWGRKTVPKMKSARTRIRTMLTAMPMPISRIASDGVSVPKSSGTSSPMTMKTNPLSRKANVSQTARPVSRASAPMMREPRCPRYSPAVTVAITPEAPSRSAGRKAA